MPTNITAPKAPIFIGTVTLADGRTYDVKQHPEFVRFFFDLMRRVGGPTAMSTDELTAAIMAAQVGEMVTQQSGAERVLADIVQVGGGDGSQLLDVMQSAGFDAFGAEATWQI